MADRPTQEWLKPDQNTGTAKKAPDSLPLPNDDRLTLDQSRADNRAGETGDWLPPGGFYKVGPLTAKIPAPGTGSLIGGRHPQKDGHLDTEDEGGVFVVKPLPGARRQMIDPDNTKPIQYPEGF